MAYSQLLNIQMLMSHDSEYKPKENLSQSTTSRTPANATKKLSPYIQLFDSSLCPKGNVLGEQHGKLGKLNTTQDLKFKTDPANDSGVASNPKTTTLKPQYQAFDDSDDSDDLESSDDSSSMCEESAPADVRAACYEASQSSDDGFSMEEFDIEAGIYSSEGKDSRPDFSCEHSRVFYDRAKIDAQNKSQVKGGIYVTDVLCRLAIEDLEDIKDNGDKLILSKIEESDKLEHYTIIDSVMFTSAIKDKREFICDRPVQKKACTACWKHVCLAGPSKTKSEIQISTRRNSRNVIAISSKGLWSCHLRRTQSETRGAEHYDNQTFKQVNNYTNEAISSR